MWNGEESTSVLETIQSILKIPVKKHINPFSIRFFFFLKEQELEIKIMVV